MVAMSVAPAFAVSSHKPVYVCAEIDPATGQLGTPFFTTAKEAHAFERSGAGTCERLGDRT
jgi:hypothetical protein